MNLTQNPVRQIDRNFLLASALFVVVVAMRWAYVRSFGVDVPFWDQWEAEGAQILIPWNLGTLELSDLFRPWNEHRLLWSRILTLGTYELSGGVWSNLQQVYINALLFSACFALPFYQYLKIRSELLWALALFLSVIIFASLPFGWENFLTGFQSQYYLMMFFSLLAMIAATRVQSFKGATVLIFLAASSIFTIASGLLAAPACAVILIVRAWNRQISWKFAALLCASLLIIFLAGYSILPVVPQHQSLKAQSGQDFFDAFILAASWPSDGSPTVAAIIWLPLLVFFGFAARRKLQNPGDVLMLGVATWTVGQAIGIAYSRGGELTSLTPRYFDIIAIGAWSEILIGLRIATLLWKPRSLSSLVGAAISITTFVTVVTMLIQRTPRDIELTQLRSTEMRVQRTHVYSYLRSSDTRELDQPTLYLPFPDSGRLKSILDDPTIKSALTKRRGTFPSRERASD